jgi:uncharacterized protein YkwD
MRQVALFILSVLLIPSYAFAYGESVEGRPSFEMRRLLLLTNVSRSDPEATLKDCLPVVCKDKHCFEGAEARQPLYWDDHYGRSALFHSSNLKSAKCGMIHSSPCVLKPDIGQTFLKSCDGSVSCACEGGVATCKSGTSMLKRIKLFGRSGLSENIAGTSVAHEAHKNLYWEFAATDACALDASNGHRWSILDKRYGTVGFGVVENGVTVQNFGAPAIYYPISSGSYIDAGFDMFKLRRSKESYTTVPYVFLAHWYDKEGKEPKKAEVIIGKNRYTMDRRLGKESGNSIWGYDSSDAL